MSLNVRKFFLPLLLLPCLMAAGTLSAQQSSSSSSPQPTNAALAQPTSIPLHHFSVEGAGGGSFGAGLLPGQYLGRGWALMAGGGYTPFRRLTIFLEGNLYHNPMPAAVLQTAQTTGGSYNIWTISANPALRIVQAGNFGIYAIGGGGFSHVATSFNQPLHINCSIYSGLGYSNFGNLCNGQITGSYSSNQPMFDFGLDLDVRLSPNHREVLFFQTRYVKLMTPANQLPGPNMGMVPILGGIRW